MVENGCSSVLADGWDEAREVAFGCELVAQFPASPHSRRRLVSRILAGEFSEDSWKLRHLAGDCLRDEGLPAEMVAGLLPFNAAAAFSHRNLPDDLALQVASTSVVTPLVRQHHSAAVVAACAARELPPFRRALSFHHRASRRLRLVDGPPEFFRRPRHARQFRPEVPLDLWLFASRSDLSDAELAQIAEIAQHAERDTSQVGAARSTAMLEAALSAPFRDDDAKAVLRAGSISALRLWVLYSPTFKAAWLRAVDLSQLFGPFGGLLAVQVLQRCQPDELVAVLATSRWPAVVGAQLAGWLASQPPSTLQPLRAAHGPLLQAVASLPVRELLRLPFVPAVLAELPAPPARLALELAARFDGSADALAALAARL